MFLVLLACTGPATVKVEGDPSETTPVDTDTTPTGTVPLAMTWTLSPEIQSLGTLGWGQDQEADVYVEWTFEDGRWAQSPTRHVGPGAQEQLVLGIPYATPPRSASLATPGAVRS